VESAEADDYIGSGDRANLVVAAAGTESYSISGGRQRQRIHDGGKTTTTLASEL